MKDNSQTSQLNQLHQQLLELTSREYTSPEWDKDALGLMSQILPLLPLCFASEICFLKPCAQLVLRSHSKDAFKSIFLHVLLLHLFNSNLYPNLANPIKIRELQQLLVTSTDKKLPPAAAVEENTELVSPFDYSFDLRKFAETNRGQVDTLLRSVLHTNSLLEKLHEGTNPGWQNFGQILAYMSQSRGIRDLVTLMFFHDEKSVALIHRSSLLASSALVHKYSQLLVELLLLRPSLVAIYSSLKSLPGAARLIPIYPQQQHAALEVAQTVPFRFILDLLNQSYKIIDFIDTTILACTSVAVQKVLLLTASKQRLYSEFNSISSVHSLLYIMNKLGCVLTQHTLRSVGEFQVAEALFNMATPKASALPPTSKPNYFFAERKLEHEDETIKMLQTLEEFHELQLIILLILKSVARIIDEELHQIVGLSHSGELTDKILARNLQQVFTFLMAAKRCNDTSDASSYITSELCDILVQVTQRVYESLDGKTSLIWVTLYNLANDLCYAEISMVPAVTWFLRQATKNHSNESQSDLIDSGFRVFMETFGEAPAGQEESEGFVEIPHNEYEFLYQKRAVPGSDEDKVTKPPNQGKSGGRQQSVHVDKYKK